ncbi:MAG: hypothetical protein EBR82_41655 [Caulobacteraceae bacterium]|nr:hypothetical protein [Caulobacteraceae bacterium]
MAGPLETAFEERLTEVEAYLVFLEELEAASLTGAPRFGATGQALSQQQTEILKAGIFVQLYNLIEAMMTKSLDALAKASIDGGWRPTQLTSAFRQEWVKVVAQVNTEMNAETRLRYAMTLAEQFVSAQPLQPFQIKKGGGGNWNDTEIEAMLTKVGLRLVLAPQVRVAVKRPYRDRLGAVGLVKKLRNDLAHGSVSFAECGQNETTAGLRDVANRTVMYMRTVVRAVDRYIDRHEYLEPVHRPIPPAAAVPPIDAEANA